MSLPPRHLTAVAACMRNEGMFLLEWVAHHKAMGFEKVFIITNGCGDGTDMMADRLDALGHICHIRNHFDAGEAPQTAGMRHLFADPRLLDVEWLLHIDADEFLNITVQGGRIRDLIDVVGQDCDAIALLWRVFGAQGTKSYQPCLVTQHYTQTSPKDTGAKIRFMRRWHKTMFRPEKFRWARDHMPKDPYSKDVRLRNTAGQNMVTDSLMNPKMAGYRGNQAFNTWANACIHHYATRSEDVFMLKNIRGDGMGRVTDKYTLSSIEWQRWNTSGLDEPSMLRHVPATLQQLQVYQSDPVLAPLEKMAFQWFLAMKAQHLTPENVQKWSQISAPPLHADAGEQPDT